MPRDGSNVYSPPAGTKGSPGTTIESSKYNAFVDDLVSDANAARPITAGGTGATTAVEGIDNLTTKGTAIASAATTNLASATGDFVHITGTTTITAFGTAAAGVTRKLVFDGILTLTHNATSLILPGAANITTAAGDTAVFVSESSGNWRCLTYQRASFSQRITGINSAVSGTSVSLTGIPLWATQISIVFVSVALSGSDDMLVRIGDSSGISTTGYVGSSTLMGGGAVASISNSTGVPIFLGGSTRILSGYVVLTRRATTEAWVVSGGLSRNDIAANVVTAGVKALTNSLDRVSVVPSGSNTFSAGTITITYQ